MLSHVHKCHGSTQCYTSPLTEIFVIVELGALSVPLASRPPTSSIPLVMTVRYRVPQTVFNGLLTAVLVGLMGLTAKIVQMVALESIE